jgi:membrane-anchored protein YejM (alkaline phosphatase superfamily)
VNRVRAWLRAPLGWFSFLLAEYLIVIALLRVVLPDRMPVAAGLAVIVAVVGALFLLNLRVRRWLAADEER